MLGAAALSLTSCKQETIPAEASKKSALMIEPTHVDLGKINEGESKTGEVAVYNNSRFPVVVEKVAASCGCTSAKVADEIIPPGGSSTLSIELSPQGRRGAFGSTVSIAWKEQNPNEPTSGEVNATFQADGLYVSNLTPGYVDFGTVSLSQEPPTQVVSVSRGTQAVGFFDMKVSSESPAISASIVKKSNDQWQIESRLSPTRLPAGPFRASILLLFQDGNGNDVHRGELSARGDIKGLVSAKPKSIFFGVVPQGVGKTGTVVFSVGDGRVAKVKSIRAEPENSILTLKPGSLENTVDYTLQTEGKTGDLSGRAFVSFEDESLGEVSIPFILHVKN